MSEKRTVICPVCGYESSGDKNYCTKCSWSFPDDCTGNAALFEGEQLKEYQERFVILRELVKNGGSEVKKQVEELERRIAVLQESEQALMKRNAELDSAVGKLRTSEYERVTENMSLRGQITDLKTKISNLQALNHNWERQNQRDRNLENEIALLRAENQKLRQRQETMNRPAATYSTPKTVVNQESTQASGAVRNTARALGPKWLPYSVNEICERISNGTFEDLYVGDSFEVEIPDYGKERFILAGFNCLPDGYKDGKGKFKDYFAVVVPEHCLESARMYVNASDHQYKNIIDDRGYRESHLYKNVLRKQAVRLHRALNEHLLHKNDQMELELMSEQMVFGQGNHAGMLPLFRLYPETRKAGRGVMRIQGSWYWLKDQKADGRFAACSPNGELSDLASNADSVGVRPYFCIG